MFRCAVARNVDQLEKVSALAGLCRLLFMLMAATLATVVGRCWRSMLSAGAGVWRKGARQDGRVSLRSRSLKRSPWHMSSDGTLPASSNSHCLSGLCNSYMFMFDRRVVSHTQLASSAPLLHILVPPFSPLVLCEAARLIEQHRAMSPPRQGSNRGASFVEALESQHSRLAPPELHLGPAMAAVGPALLQLSVATGTNCEADGAPEPEEGGQEVYPDTDDETLYMRSPSSDYTYPGGMMSDSSGLHVAMVARSTAAPFSHGWTMGHLALCESAAGPWHARSPRATEVIASPSTRSLSGSFDASWSSAASCLGSTATASPGETTRPQSPARATCSPKVADRLGHERCSGPPKLHAASSDEMRDLHLKGSCRPCPWFWRDAGCRNGSACAHCHLCSDDVGLGYRRAKMLRRKKLRGRAGGPAARG